MLKQYIIILLSRYEVIGIENEHDNNLRIEIFRAKWIQSWPVFENIALSFH